MRIKDTIKGKRDPKILAKKLPMALIHECVGIVISDPSGTYKVGQKVVMIPNQPPRASDEEFYENYMSGHISYLVDMMVL